MKNIVTLSGGATSAYVAKIVLDEIDSEAELVFTDPKWEHRDLYRFLKELEVYYGKPITYLQDGRTPEELFYSDGLLANNRMPICSKKLKGKVLQDYIKTINDEVTLFFGIDYDEQHRAVRIRELYKKMGVHARFPLVEREELLMKNEYMKEIENEWGIQMPELYKAGFSHNNCSGGCVRQGKKSWLMLLKTYPDVFAERERVEREFSEYKGGNYTFLKDSEGKPYSLEQLRKDEAERGEGEQLLFPEDEPCMCFEV